MTAPTSTDVAELIDRVAVSDLLAAYCSALDAQDWARLREVFVPDAECDYGTLGNPKGADAIVSLVSSTLTGLDATQHLVGNVVVRLNGDRASADCYLISQHVRTGTPGGDHYLLGGRYEDRLVRTPEGWRIAFRRLHRMWVMGNREVVQRP